MKQKDISTDIANLAKRAMKRKQALFSDKTDQDVKFENDSFDELESYIYKEIINDGGCYERKL
ncbi:MAG: hypothetical protein HFE98_06780 [Ruminiclostridium sp.]|nr:hypothetical protein [Ruminiclostridium sp.]